MDTQATLHFKKTKRISVKSAVWETSEPHKVRQIHQFYGKGNIDGSNLDLAAMAAAKDGKTSYRFTTEKRHLHPVWQ